MTPFCDPLKQQRILVGSWILVDQQIQKTKSPEIVNFLCSTTSIIRAIRFRVCANVTLRQLRQLFRYKKVQIFYNIHQQKRYIFVGQEMVQNEQFSQCTNWTNRDFLQSAHRQKTRKNVKIVIIDSTLLSGIFDFDRGQPKVKNACFLENQVTISKRNAATPRSSFRSFYGLFKTIHKV